MAKKKAAKSKGRKRTTSKRKAGAGARAKARSASAKRKTARAKTPRTKTRRKQAKKPTRPAKRKAMRAKSLRRSSRTRSRRAKAGAKTVKKAAPRRLGGTGRESELAQTPETGRTVRGLTNPMPTRRSTGTAAGAGNTRRAPALERARKQLREIEETVEGPPSSLDMERGPSAARSGRQKLKESIEEHHEGGPALTAATSCGLEDAYRWATKPPAATT